MMNIDLINKKGIHPIPKKYIFTKKEH